MFKLSVLTFPIGSSAKLNSEVRLDLINEINDEFLDEDLLAMGQHSRPPQPHISLDEEDEDERCVVGKGVTMGGAESGNSMCGDDDDDDDDDEEGENSSLNLTNLRVSIEGLDECDTSLGATASGGAGGGGGARNGYVFVVRVWNLDPRMMERAGGGETPNWFVRRKYDEFYVLDSRLRQFHGGSLAMSSARPAGSPVAESASRSAGVLRSPTTPSVAQLPVKPRAILSFSNKENSLEYLESVQNDFERYLQVNLRLNL